MYITLSPCTVSLGMHMCTSISAHAQLALECTCVHQSQPMHPLECTCVHHSQPMHPHPRNSSKHGRENFATTMIGKLNGHWSCNMPYGLVNSMVTRQHGRLQIDMEMREHIAYVRGNYRSHSTLQCYRFKHILRMWIAAH